MATIYVAMSSGGLWPTFALCVAREDRTQAAKIIGLVVRDI
jgi:hypothetical protein